MIKPSDKVYNFRGILTSLLPAAHDYIYPSNVFALQLWCAQHFHAEATDLRQESHGGRVTPRKR